MIGYSFILIFYNEYRSNLMAVNRIETSTIWSRNDLSNAKTDSGVKGSSQPSAIAPTVDNYIQSSTSSPVSDKRASIRQADAGMSTNLLVDQLQSFQSDSALSPNDARQYLYDLGFDPLAIVNMSDKAALRLSQIDSD